MTKSLDCSAKIMVGKWKNDLSRIQRLLDELAQRDVDMPDLILVSSLLRHVFDDVSRTVAYATARDLLREGSIVTEGEKDANEEVIK